MHSIPYDEGFEKAVLVSILTDPSLLPRIQQIVVADDFFKGVHKEIFEVISGLSFDNIDSLTVKDKLQESSKAYFQALVEESDYILPTISNAIYYAETIKSKSVLRRGIDLGTEIVTLCYEANDAESASQKLEDIFAKFIRNRINDKSELSTNEQFDSFIDNLGEKLKDTGIKTGFNAIDRFLHKMEGLNILAARSSVGKTAFALNIAKNVAQHKPVLFFSLEQSREQLFERLLAMESGVGLESIITGSFFSDRDSVLKIRETQERIKPLINNLIIDDRASVPASYITSVSRQTQFERGQIGLIVVDYLHIMVLSEKSNSVEGLGEATRDLRALGKELGCPVLLLAQLKRLPEATGMGENKTPRRPDLSDLRGSGEIEQNADVVIFLHRDSYNDKTMGLPNEDDVEILISKNRNGRIGISNVIWYPRILRYEDLR